MIHFSVIGIPKPAGSKTGFPNKKTGGVIIVDASGKAGKLWRKQVALRAKEVMQNREIRTGELCVTMEFMLPRPKSHFNSKGVLKDDNYKDPAPKHHTTTPDVLKLARAVEDAMSGIVYVDDKQIIKEIITKDYAELESGVVITIN